MPAFGKFFLPSYQRSLGFSYRNVQVLEGEEAIRCPAGGVPAEPREARAHAREHPGHAARRLAPLQALRVQQHDSRPCKFGEGQPGHQKKIPKFLPRLQISIELFYLSVQAWISRMARETVSLGRELMGGNGIVTDFLVAKVPYQRLFLVSFRVDYLLQDNMLQAFCDLEPIYSYEGTYEINSLITGREITGIASFKPSLQINRSRL